jgi:hypothetical protein
MERRRGIRSKRIEKGFPFSIKHNGMKTKEFGEGFKKRSDKIQWSFENHSNGEVEKGFASPLR